MRYKVLLASLMLLITMAVVVQPAAATDVFNAACSTPGAGTSSACTGHTKTNPLIGSGGTLQRVTRIVATITGAVAVIMMIVGGIMYIFSGGDSGKVNSAKNTVLYAAVGLVIIVLAQGLIVFILNKV